ncbi:MAG: prephenate dehydrogenase [Lachnospiraceae bacterium]|nr:prephenate dehydrogenase [Lachnospiraceae bacterium]
MNYQKIGFIGLGLIGGSIAKAIKHYFPDIRLYAHAHSQSTITEANKAGVTENDSALPLSAFADMDIVFLCSPVQVNMDYLRKLAPILSPHTLLTDVGSVKGEIVTCANALGLERQFIGGHPMTGSEKTGFMSADPLLLENAYYILCENEASDPEMLRHFRVFLTALGADVLMLDPHVHDHAVAAISHLPHIVAAALVNLIRKNDNTDQVMRTIAAGGFKDITRIASSSPVMWQNICAENRDEILTLIDLYRDALDSCRSLVEARDTDSLLSFFSEAKEYRDSMPVRAKGLLPAALDFYVDLKDEAGQIAAVATLLAAVKLSIKNIGIVHNREFSDGVLHIEMYDAPSKEAAMAILKQHGYRLYGK